ncbi:hypothetical protein DSM104443_02890 [Usitatibacter rugosus]|uniref:Type II secretion system protein K n=1 Tax=Usitatibacter rugosus TaxID=2732067 RepID=A0A6M4H1U0_9PROT|nr:type II secretion system minor pseudopilin GspK [Usitatibacter rugosus]QJR11807.1 hypothetical protein DSM104443_02890 [Usitatibacter rugosus]
MKQRGVAAVTALLIVAVAASTAMFMLSQQSALLNQATLVASRAQADLYARAGLDWARGVIAEDGRTASAVDSLGEPWAQPISALPVERALVSGVLFDEQGKYNLNNLVGLDKKASLNDEKIARRLFASLGVNEDLVPAVIDWIDADSDLVGTAGAEDPYYLSLARPYRPSNQPMVQVEELYRIRGFDSATVAKLKPYVTALPARTPVNVNTAAAEVILAIAPEVPAEQVAAFVKSRNALPIKSPQQIFERWAKVPAGALGNDLDVKSGYFIARVQVAQDDVQLASEALIERKANAAGSTAIIWRRPLY